MQLKSEFSKNVLTLMTGATIAQAIPIAISPILTRIYTPEDFGIFALYMGLASFIAIVATGRYELAIMLPEKETDAINLVALSLIIATCISLLSFFVVFVFNDYIISLLGVPEIANWLYLIPISVLLTGIFQSLNYWKNRQKQYKALAASKVGQSASAGLTNISLGTLGFGFTGMILSRLLGQIMSIYILLKTMKTEDFGLMKEVSKISIIQLMKEYKKFPLINSANAMIDSFRLASINILIARLFSNTLLGQFTLAWQMVQVPVSLLGSSLSQVFFQRISKVDNEEFYEVIKTFLIKASLLAAPIFILIYIFAVDIFEVVFGSEWIISGELASVMSPWIFLNFLSAPMAHVFIVLNKQEVILKVSIVYMLVPLMILFFGRNLEFIEVLHFIVVAMSTILLFYIMLALKYAKNGVNNVV